MSEIPDVLIYESLDDEADVRLFARERPEFGTWLIETINTGESNHLFIPAEHRAAVALALLGEPTDEMIERAAHALNRAPYTPWTLLPNGMHMMLREEAKQMLEAAFGLET